MFFRKKKIPLPVKKTWVGQLTLKWHYDNNKTFAHCYLNFYVNEHGRRSYTETSSNGYSDFYVAENHACFHMHVRGWLDGGPNSLIEKILNSKLASYWENTNDFIYKGDKEDIP